MQNAIKKQGNFITILFVTSLTLLLVTSIGIVYTKHTVRNLFTDLEHLQSERDELENDWTKLLLEQSAWASETRIDEIARQQLALNNPAPQQVVMVRS